MHVRGRSALRIRRSSNNLLRLLHRRSPRVVAVVVLVLLITVLVMRPVSAAVAYRAAGTGNNAAGATTLSIAQPTGTLAGDVLIAVVSVRGGTGTTITPPTQSAPYDWKAVPSGSADSTTTLKSTTYYKIVGPSDSGPYVFTFNGTQKASGVIVGFTGVDIGDPIDVAGSQANASNTAMIAPSVTTTVPNAMLVAAYSTATGTTVTVGSSMTLAGQDASTGGSAATRTTSGTQYVLQATSGASGTKTMTAAATAVNIGHLIALKPAPTISQASYRLFANTDSTTASTPLAAIDTAASVEKDAQFRLRINLGVASGGSMATAVTTRTYTLQFAARGADNVCDSSFTSETYANVTASTVVRYSTNPTPADGATYVTSANDPTRSGITAVGQRYHESATMTMASTIPAGQDGLWDIVLSTSGASFGQRYCMRIVDGFGAVLNGSYSVMPEIVVATPTITQANYRWFTNADSATPGAPLVAQDTPITNVATGTPIRLRQRLAINVAALPASAQDFKLQYAEKSGSCDTAFSGESYTDFMQLVAMTDTQDPSSLSSSGIGIAWVNEANARLIDNTDAMVTGIANSVGQVTKILNVTGFNFNIPTSAIIDGIELTVQGSESPSGNSFGLMITGNNGDNIYSSGSGSLSTGSQEIFGSATDSWGITSATQINGTGIGINFQVQLPSLPQAPAMFVDGFQEKVYYRVPQSNGTLQYFDNTSVASGAVISSGGNDPVNGARPTVLQAYYETDPFVVSSSIANGSDGLWDFVFTTTGAAAGKTYCLRTVKSSGGLLDTYTNIPEISFASAGGPTLDQKTRGGQAVVDGVKSPYSF